MSGSNVDYLRSATTVLFVVTLFVTSYRCFVRYAKGLWWHDDSAALLSAISFTIFLIGSTYIANESSSNGRRVLGYYLVVIGFYTPIWGARASIALTLIRITPWRVRRRILLGVTVFFALEFITLTVQAFWVCEFTHSRWKQTPGAICLLPQVVPISQVIATVVSDTLLITSPLMILRGIRIRALRFRVLSIFSVSIATTLASIVHATLMIIKPGVWEAISGAVEVAVSIVVCNMSVIIPAVLRALGVGDPFMQEDTVESNFSTIKIARTTSTGISLGLSKTPNATIPGEEANVVDTVGSHQLGSADSNPTGDQRHQLRDGCLGLTAGQLEDQRLPAC